MEVKTKQDVELADKLVQLRKAYEGFYATGIEASGQEGLVKVALANALDLSNPGWKERQDFVDRIKEVGAVEASRKLLDRYQL